MVDKTFKIKARRSLFDGPPLVIFTIGSHHYMLLLRTRNNNTTAVPGWEGGENQYLDKVVCVELFSASSMQRKVQKQNVLHPVKMYKREVSSWHLVGKDEG